MEPQRFDLSRDVIERYYGRHSNRLKLSRYAPLSFLTRLVPAYRVLWCILIKARSNRVKGYHSAPIERERARNTILSRVNNRSCRFHFCYNHFHAQTDYSKGMLLIYHRAITIKTRFFSKHASYLENRIKPKIAGAGINSKFVISAWACIAYGHDGHGYMGMIGIMGMMGITLFFSLLFLAKLRSAVCPTVRLFLPEDEPESIQVL